MATRPPSQIPPRRIPLIQGLYAVVDDEDYAWLVTYKWSVITVSLDLKYAVRHQPRTKSKMIYMHRQILEVAPGQHVDHRNHDGLDNRRSNLRICTHAQNCQNKRPNRECSSSYKGVSWYKSKRLWSSAIKVSGVRKHLGYFKNEVDAAKAYDDAARKYFGEFAFLNFHYEFS